MSPKCGGWAVLLLCVGCESVPEATFDAAVDSTRPEDGAAQDEATSDSGPTAPCDLSAPFANPEPVPGINTSVQDEGFFLSADGLRATFARGGTGPTRVYTSTRDNLDAPFIGSSQISLGETSGSDFSTRPRVSPDGLELYFDSTRGGMQSIYVATRATTQGSFGNSARVPLSTGDAAMGSFAPSGTLYYHSNQTGTGAKVYSAKRSTQGFQSSVLLNIDGRQPVVTADGSPCTSPMPIAPRSS